MTAASKIIQIEKQDLPAEEHGNAVYDPATGLGCSSAKDEHGNGHYEHNQAGLGGDNNFTIELLHGK